MVAQSPLIGPRRGSGGTSGPAPVLAALAALALQACGGADDPGRTASPPSTPADASAPAAGLPRPDWISLDEPGHAVTIRLVAGADETNDRWNYNGHANGDATVVVPEGVPVTIELTNEDPATRHSVAVLEPGRFPVTFEDPSPSFAGAMTPDATSTAAATAPGESDSIAFTADRAGRYALVCLVPAHAATGMWIGFDVSASGELGLRR